MGLDITAYKNLTKLDGVKYLEGEVYDHSLTPLDCDKYDMIAYANPYFQGRIGSIEDGAVYKAGDAFGFRAGSYGGYNSWRETLAKIAGYPLGSYRQYNKDYESYCASAWEAASGPFWELINFSDCEGVIGPEVSAKLAKDFADFADKAALEDGYFSEKYQDWKQAFELAAQNGAVLFH